MVSKFADPMGGPHDRLKCPLEAPLDRVDHINAIEVNASPERVRRAITEGEDTADRTSAEPGFDGSSPQP